jgi:hypothetical protein
MAIQFLERSLVVVNMIEFETVKETVFSALSAWGQQGKTDCHCLCWNNFPNQGQCVTIRYWATQQDIIDYLNLCNQTGAYVSTRIMSPEEVGPQIVPTFDGIRPPIS